MHFHGVTTWFYVFIYDHCWLLCTIFLKDRHFAAYNQFRKVFWISIMILPLLPAFNLFPFPDLIVFSAFSVQQTWNASFSFSSSSLRVLMLSHWSLSDSKSQVSRTLLIILANLNNTVVWMVSPCPLISKSSSPSTNLWWLHQLQLVSSSLSCSIVFFLFSSKV